MTTSGKIRLLLSLIGICLLITAIIVQKTYTPVNNLVQTGITLENNLHKKEAYINAQINDKLKFRQLKNLPDNEQEALNDINEFTNINHIWFVTLHNNHLKFWSGIKVIPDNLTGIQEGYSFIKQPNGYYETIKKTSGDFSIIFFIPIKVSYAFENQYLQNTFDKDLVKDDNIDIADFSDQNIYEVHSSNNDYLFSIKLKANSVNYAFVYYELAFWLLTVMTLCILMHNICCHVASKDYALLSVVFLAMFIVLFRYINLHYNLPDFAYTISVFNPAYYASSVVYPSLGDFCINILCIFWFVIYLYLQRHRLFTAVPGKVASYVIVVVCILVLIVTSTLLLNLFYGLVINSKISFNVNNVLSLSGFSMLGVLMLCFSFLIFYIINEIALFVCLKLIIPRSHQLFLLMLGVVLITIVFAWFKEYTSFYILWSALVVIRGYGFLYHNGRLNAVTFLSIILICSLISAIKLNHFEGIKERQTREALVQKLEVPDDATADYIFKRIEDQIIADSAIIGYFNQGNSHNIDFLKTRFQKLYFDGYLSKYEFKVHEYNEQDQPITDDNYSLNVFKDLVLYSSFKVSDYFYRENESFGFQNYFAILPVNYRGKQLGTLVIELKSKPLQPSGSFPELLVDGHIKPEDEFKDYSYAFYIDNKLLSQKGNYVYSLDNTEFKGEIKKIPG